ncbi:hypothetical protein PP996_gp47 [Gordonia phage SheckWes]|uniref:Uncharacterized protein n=1 Tax=Gordonia phage SheckWes TaxID=2591117 RepID=A0A515MIH6_9CAUD|nr:hypothetical protein PP996_gp47 [Gordonia phage SheckWes]QDM56473.1 hypothetical protein SEA_SHECKWES_47 [Gordonia phage SheckWes]
MIEHDRVVLETQNRRSKIRFSPRAEISCATCGIWERLEKRPIRKTFREEGRQRFEALCRPCNAKWEKYREGNKGRAKTEVLLELFIRVTIHEH